MSIFLLLTLLLLPVFNAEPIQNQFETNPELLLQRSVAANYLFGLPTRRYQHQLMNPIYGSPSLLLTSDSDDQQQQQQRGKRIYWENLAFQPADYNQKAKNPKRSK